MTTLISPDPTAPEQSPATGWDRSRFLPRWIGANAVAEALGLGGSALLTMQLLPHVDAATGVLLAGLVVVIGSTLLEGTAVGLAQWLVLRSVLPRLSRNAWWLATMAGALIAWLLGMLPSTIMSMQEAGGSAPTAEEPAAWIIYLLSAAILVY